MTLPYLWSKSYLVSQAGGTHAHFVVKTRKCMPCIQLVQIITISTNHQKINVPGVCSCKDNNSTGRTYKNNNQIVDHLIGNWKKYMYISYLGARVVRLRAIHSCFSFFKFFAFFLVSSSSSSPNLSLKVCRVSVEPLFCFMLCVSRRLSLLLDFLLIFSSPTFRHISSMCAWSTGT